MRAVATCTDMGAMPDRALDVTVLLVLVRRDWWEVGVVSGIPRVHRRIADWSTFGAAERGEDVGLGRSSKGAVVRVNGTERAVLIRRRRMMLLRGHCMVVLLYGLLLLNLLLRMLDMRLRLLRLLGVCRRVTTL